MKKIKDSGVTPVKGLLIVLAVVLLGGVGVYVNKVNSDNKQLSSATTTPNGDLVSPTDQNTPKQQKPVEEKYLTIKEWGVKLKLTDSIKDAYYDTKDLLSSNDTVGYSLRVHSLDSEPACKDSDASVSAISRVPVNLDDPANPGKKFSESRVDSGTTIGSYFYYIESAQYPCAQNPDKQELLGYVRIEFNLAGKSIVIE